MQSACYIVLYVLGLYCLSVCPSQMLLQFWRHVDALSAGFGPGALKK